MNYNLSKITSAQFKTLLLLIVAFPVVLGLLGSMLGNLVGYILLFAEQLRFEEILPITLIFSASSFLFGLILGIKECSDNFNSGQN